MTETETILDSVTIASGGTATGTFGKDGDVDQAVIEITDFDGNSTDLDVAVSKASGDLGGTLRTMPSGSAETAVDASTDGALVTLTGLAGIEKVQVQVTNNAASGTTVTVKETTQY